MYKLFPVFFLLCCNSIAQKLYTPIRAGVGGEAFGIAPKAQLYVESYFGYKARSFWDIQAGMGIVDGSDFLTYSFSGALTYSYLLNPYRRTQCNPVPGHRRFETYLEGGIASFFSDTRFNEPVFYVSNTSGNLCLLHSY